VIVRQADREKDRWENRQTERKTDRWMGKWSTEGHRQEDSQTKRHRHTGKPEIAEEETAEVAGQSPSWIHGQRA